MIDDAADLATDGKIKEAVEKYRAALIELDNIERDNPERVSSPEFATLRNKRAYVNAAIDSLLLKQVRGNAKTVAVSDTADLEERLRREREEKAAKAAEAAKPPVKDPVETPEATAPETTPAVKSAPAQAEPEAAKPQSLRKLALENLAAGDLAAAEMAVLAWLAAVPDNPAALNLKAAVEARQGRFQEAEATLDLAIRRHPGNHCAYYNKASLLLQTKPDDKSAAKRYYDIGRSTGGPADAELEAALK